MNNSQKTIYALRVIPKGSKRPSTYYFKPYNYDAAKKAALLAQSGLYGEKFLSLDLETISTDYYGGRQ